MNSAFTQSLMFHGVRPVLKRLPVVVFVWICTLVSIPRSVVILAKRRAEIARILRTIKRPTTLWQKLQLSYAMAYQRMRFLEQYIYERPPLHEFVWVDGEPETRRCVYVMCNTFGQENIRPFNEAVDAETVWKPWDRELLDQTAQTPSRLKWRRHMANVRQALCEGRTVTVGENPLSYRRLMRGRRSIVIFQDVWDEEHRPPHYRFLGQDVALRYGGVRIARKAGLPLRFIRVYPKGQRWIYRVEPPMEPQEPTLIRHMEEQITRHPASWMRWEYFFDHVDGRPPSASGI